MINEVYLNYMEASMKTIYFVRHSLRDTRIQDDLLAPLTAEGHAKALKITHKFKDIEIDKIYSSPALRAIQTVEKLADDHKLEILLSDNLLERQIGAWVEYFNQFTLKQWQDFDYQLDDGESLNDARARILQFYQCILNSPDRNIVISSHGTILALLFNYLDSNFGFENWRQMTMPDLFQLKLNESQILSFERIELN